MMKKYLNLLLLLFCGLANAATTDIERETIGYGPTYQEALSSALLEAVRQIRGLEVGTEKTLRTQISQSVSGQGNVLTTGNEKVSVDIYTKSKGWIKSYEVLQVIKPENSDDQWQVTTLVTVPVFKSNIKNDNRKTIAILPFDMARSQIRTPKLNLSINNINTRIADGILSEITQSRKFAVLNRDFEQQLSKERRLLASKQVSAAEASRLGNKLGADFMVLGNIHQITLKKSNADFYGAKSHKVLASIDLSYSVIEAATEKVMWADSITHQFSAKKEGRIVSDFVSDLSAKIVTNILDVIYPVKILKIQSKSRILLNQGGKRLRVGQIMEVYSTGESLIDPDTGMRIKVDGVKVGELKITQVKPKYSISAFVKDSGAFNDLAVKAITRRINTTQTQNNFPSREAPPSSSDKPVNW